MKYMLMNVNLDIQKTEDAEFFMLVVHMRGACGALTEMKGHELHSLFLMGPTGPTSSHSFFLTCSVFLNISYVFVDN